jgi:threonine/homoserine/homoserine lactone efflux protein
MDSCYLILLAKLKWLLASKYIDRIINGVSGVLFIGAGGFLAATNRTEHYKQQYSRLNLD